MLVEEKEETKPADSKLAMGKEKQMNKTKTNKQTKTHKPPATWLYCTSVVLQSI